MKSISVVFPGRKQVEVIEEEIPDAPGPGEIMVQTLVSHISTGTEMWCYQGDFDDETSWAGWVKYPFYPGYSNVGQVIRVGEGVEQFQEGDRIWTLKGHVQYAIHSVDSLCALKLPDYATDEDASWGALAFVTQTGVRRAGHHMGDDVVLIGLGPLGQLTTQYVRLMGAREIIAIDTVQQRLDIALEHGATQAFCGSAAEAGDFVREHTDGRLGDVVYDITGHWAVLPMALPLARNHGTVVLLGDTPYPSRQCLTQDVLARQVRIIGTHNAKLDGVQVRWSELMQIELFLQYIHRGQMHVADLITHRYTPEEAPQVYTMLLEDRSATLGVLFDWGK